MITVAALTAGVNTPSSRFRIRQYIPRLTKEGIKIREYIPYFEKSCGLPSPFKAAARIPALIRSRKADIVWVGKELVKGYYTFERLLKRPRIMDVDDAIWQNFPFGPWTTPKIARSMDAIVAGNQYLADYFSRYCRDVYIVPTSIDLDRYQLRNFPDIEPEKFIIGWTGLACNYKYLKQIAPILKRFLQDHDRTEILIISNRPMKQSLLPADKTRFVRWNAKNETVILREMSVGIMPLRNDKWSRGKCGFKMLQYMAAGLPVIVSPVGVNKEILQKAEVGYGAESAEDWYEALDELYHDWSGQKQMGLAGRKVVEEFYNNEIVSKELAGIFRNVAGK